MSYTNVSFENVAVSVTDPLPVAVVGVETVTVESTNINVTGFSLETTLSKQYNFKYETVAASQTAQVLGVTGAVGDYLHRLIINNITVATASVTLLDDTTSIVIQTGGAALVAGVMSLELDMVSATGAWSVTTGAGATVIAVGIFSA